MKISDNLKVWAKRIKRDGVTLWFAGKHPATPWYAKALGLFVVAYALSPIDLIPDFIPVLGYVDDILLLPALIWLAIKLLPTSVIAECRAQADAWMVEKGSRPSSRAGAVMIIMLWIGIGIAAWLWLSPQVHA
ncbi:YkvA family protein [Comamonas sp.]|uniref:YkvA family protein n=1 Tax=Comamonas sp. TaxID=34028 RepID=UPI003A93C911